MWFRVIGFIFLDWEHGSFWGGSSNYSEDYGIASQRGSAAHSAVCGKEHGGHGSFRDLRAAAEGSTDWRGLSRYHRPKYQSGEPSLLRSG